MRARGADTLQTLEFDENVDASLDDPLALRLQAELDEYFAGSRTEFTIPLGPRGTEFQQIVWRIVSTVPYGSTKTYSEIARELGDVQKTRSVGAAIGANPILILVPCHRIVALDGELTGYSGGLERKQLLLELEGGQGTLF
ncbi:MAG: methylated-DNA--[protein]-cysteine S-methyltransferase [Chthonomonas sp.]|nr:methylated-DNA--[protein]-cysteine S-methyltransferase [Chthonomonas sp.]